MENKDKIFKRYQDEVNHSYTKHTKTLDNTIMNVFNEYVTRDYNDITKDDMV